jgi:hypothetical protein
MAAVEKSAFFFFLFSFVNDSKEGREKEGHFK